jgi:FtsH-binding integral membrane protein
MTQNLNLKEIEKKVWTSTFEDGITDIGIGLVLLVSTICQMFNDERFYLYPLFIVPALFIIIAKKYITVPRMGLVKFSRERNKKRYTLFLVMTISIVFLLMLTTKGLLQQLPMTSLIVGAIVFIIPCSIAYFLNWDRMYIYAVLFTLSFALNEITIANTGVVASGAYAWLISGMMITVVGVVYLIRFMKKYPLPEKEVYDVSDN